MSGQRPGEGWRLEPGARTAPLRTGRLVLVGAVVVAVVALIGWRVLSASSTIELRGALTVTSSQLSGGVNSCVGTGSFGDIGAGTVVTVADPQGRTVARGALSAGHEHNTTDSTGAIIPSCTFGFDIQVPSRVSTYLVSVGARGTATYSQAQVLDGPIQLNLSGGGTGPVGTG